jgi:hypothetical protein
MIALHRQRAVRGPRVCCRRLPWAVTLWRQVSSDPLCPTYFIIHCPAYHDQPKDWLVFSFSCPWLSFGNWLLWLESCYCLILINEHHENILWYDDVILDMMMNLWYFRGLWLFPEYLSVRTCSLDDHPRKQYNHDGGWDTLSWLIRGTWGVVGFAVVPSIGSGHSTCSAKAVCQDYFVLLLLVTLPMGRGTVFIKLEKPNGQLRPLGNPCKGYLVKPCRFTLVMFEGLTDPRQKGITTRG